MSRPQPDEPTGKLAPVVEKAVRAAGFELESLDVRSVGRRRLVRVVVDVSDVPAAAPTDIGATAAGNDVGEDGVGGDGVGEDGVEDVADLDLDAVADLSRTVAAELDAHDELLGGPYTLEVSSPGTDRPLTRPRHWRRARLRQVRIRRCDGTEIVGRLGPSDDTRAVVLVDGTLHTVRYAEVDHALVQVEFRPPPPDELSTLSGAAATAALTATSTATSTVDPRKEETR